jgi:SAM-dependent methyltransferase
VSGPIDGPALDALLSPEGQALLAELSVGKTKPGSEIALITRLRKKHSPTLVAAAIETAELRRRAQSKFTNASRMYFTRAGLEQASSERMSRHHAERYAAFDRIGDLCCGIGGDLIGLAESREVVAVDIDPVHLRIAALNAEVNEVERHVTTELRDVREADLDCVRAAFIDPARRSGDKRFATGASEPPLSWCFGLAERGLALGIKAAPGLPSTLAPDGWELEFISERRELKECVLWSPSLATTGRRSTILPEGHTLTERVDASLDVREPGRFLIDPDGAVTRAGLVKELGMTLGDCWQIDEQVAFLSSDHMLETPFGRTLEVAASEKWNLRRLKQLLNALDVGSVDIRKRGSAVEVEDIQSRLKLSGTRGATVVLTRVRNQPWMFVCAAPTASQ